MSALARPPFVVTVQAGCLAIKCPLGFVHGYRCARCSWATLFPDCHVAWAVPFCYLLRARRQYAEHHCDAGRAGASSAPPGCRTCDLD